MPRLRYLLILVSLAVLTFNLMGCAAKPAAALPPLPSAPAVVTPIAVVTSGGAVTAIPFETGTAVPPVSPAPTVAGALMITRENNGQTLTLHVGERFVLSLGEGYNWTLDISDQAVLHRVVNITPLRGSQGVFEALAPGSAKLTGTGDPPCRQATPACAMPSFLFELNVTVVP